MKKFLLSLSIALTSWTLMPATASALPSKSCSTVCSCSTPCITRCRLGDAVVSCGFVELCNGMCADDPSDEEMSAMDQEGYEYSEEDLVCRALEG